VRRAAAIEDVDRGVQVGRALGEALGHSKGISGAQKHVQTPRLDVGGLIERSFNEFSGCHRRMVRTVSDGFGDTNRPGEGC